MEPELAKSILTRLDDMICFRLFTSVVPPQISKINVSRGKAVITVVDEYEVILGIENMREQLWKILSLRLLVGHSGTSTLMHEMQIQRITDTLQKRMMISEQPLVEMHNILHYLAVNVMMETLRIQAQGLKDSRAFEGND
jgi:hypothetical protein